MASNQKATWGRHLLHHSISDYDHCIDDINWRVHKLRRRRDEPNGDLDNEDVGKAQIDPIQGLLEVVERVGPGGLVRRKEGARVANGRTRGPDAQDSLRVEIAVVHALSAL